MSLMNGIENSINGAVTDMVHHADSIIHNEIYALNQEFYEGYQWIAALDNSTCLICANLDNQIFDLLPDMEPLNDSQTTAPPQPIHKFCRCFMVPVLIGDRAATQAGPNYQDWLKRQSDADQLDILGPSRFALFKSGKEIRHFIKDNQIMTLKGLKASRIKRKTLVRKGVITDQELRKSMRISGITEEGVTGFGSERRISPMAEKLINSDIYPRSMFKWQIVDKFNERWPGVNLALGKHITAIPKDNLRIIASSLDELLQRHPEAMKTLKSIRFSDVMVNSLASYSPELKRINFNAGYMGKKLMQIHSAYFRSGEASTRRADHTIIHEFAHAVDRAFERRHGGLGRDALIKQLADNGFTDWKAVSENFVSRYGKNSEGEFFAEAFTKWSAGGFVDKPSGSRKQKIHNIFNSFFSGMRL